ncbi:MAG TPA: type II secretion system protein [Tepidisphaeraceae bacterium]|jgi:prepilin-type N-terminal cleavage/methylation domain-containing protein|nr:type II secretion system protein [Tepidisphaeraceae bacterium]
MSKLFRRPGDRRGFTMIELLTVIGIIVILMSILIPVVSKVRQISLNTDTTHFLTKIATACQNYYQDFRSYPGPLPETAVHGYNTSLANDSPNTPAPGFAGPPQAITTTPINPVGASPFSDVTSSQNLVLGLLGGLILPTGATSPSYDVTLIPKGPQVLNVLAAQQIPPYIDPSKYDISSDGTGNLATAIIMATGGLTPGGHTRPTPGTYLLPEFMDHYPQANPIIYFRARAGASSACDITSGAGNAGSQYYSAEMGPYAPDFFSQVDRNNNYQTLYTGMAPGSGYGYGLLFFQNQVLDNPPNTVPRAKDAFILLSAGYDGLYGTKDDIVYPPQNNNN